MSYQPLLLKSAVFLGSLISISAASSILTLSYFSIPQIRSTSRDLSTPHALHQLRSLFSSGSYIYPTLAFSATVAYAFAAYHLPQKRFGYIIAAAGSIGIAPFTTRVMVPLANQRLIDLDKAAGRGDLKGKKGVEEVEVLLKRFEWLNGWRAGIMAVGGVVGLWLALV